MRVWGTIRIILDFMIWGFGKMQKAKCMQQEAAWLLQTASVHSSEVLALWLALWLCAIYLPFLGPGFFQWWVNTPRYLESLLRMYETDLCPRTVVSIYMSLQGPSHPMLDLFQGVSLIGSGGLECSPLSHALSQVGVWGVLQKCQVEGWVSVPWPQLNTCIHLCYLPSPNTAVSQSLYSHNLWSTFLSTPILVSARQHREDKLLPQSPSKFEGKAESQNQVSSPCRVENPFVPLLWFLYL